MKNQQPAIILEGKRYTINKEMYGALKRTMERESHSLAQKLSKLNKACSNTPYHGKTLLMEFTPSFSETCEIQPINVGKDLVIKSELLEGFNAKQQNQLVEIIEHLRLCMNDALRKRNQDITDGAKALRKDIA